MTRAKNEGSLDFLLHLTFLILVFLLIFKPILFTSDFTHLSSTLSISRGKQTSPTSHSHNKTPGKNDLSTLTRSKSSPSCSLSTKQLSLFIILLAGDIQLNPGPCPQTSTYPCGTCELPVTWSSAGICCDQCDVWHHKSCIDEMNSEEFSKLENSASDWNCFKCKSISSSSFTYHSFCLESSTDAVSFAHSSASTIPSPPHNPFPPTLKSSTPRPPRSPNSPPTSPPNLSSISSSSSDSSTNPLLRTKETFGNLRILNINCQGIRGKVSEFKNLLQYTKPDVVCGTESWLHSGVKSSEIFPCDDYEVFRKDRDSENGGGGVFTLVRNNLIALEMKELDSNCEILWVKIKLKKAKELLISTFYMPHRNMDSITEFESSVMKANPKGNKNMIICGDFNCPYYWNYGFTHDNAPEKNVQDNLIDIYLLIISYPNCKRSLPAATAYLISPLLQTILTLGT